MARKRWPLSPCSSGGGGSSKERIGVVMEDKIELKVVWERCVEEVSLTFNLINLFFFFLFFSESSWFSPFFYSLVLFILCALLL